MVCFLLLATGNLAAQKLERHVQSTTGNGGLIFDDFQIDYTVGEVMIHRISIEGLTLTQGFQQPPTGKRVIEGLNDDMILYPNPTWGDAAIKFTLDTLVQHVDVRIVNIMGQLAFTDKIMSPPKPAPGEARPLVWVLTYSFSTARLVPGIYIIQIKTNSGFAVTKKFVKMRE